MMLKWIKSLVSVSSSEIYVPTEDVDETMNVLTGAREEPFLPVIILPLAQGKTTPSLSRSKSEPGKKLGLLQALTGECDCQSCGQQFSGA